MLLSLLLVGGCFVVKSFKEDLTLELLHVREHVPPHRPDREVMEHVHEGELVVLVRDDEERC